jgi:hypothetical protein
MKEVWNDDHLFGPLLYDSIKDLGEMGTEPREVTGLHQIVSLCLLERDCDPFHLFFRAFDSAAVT